MNKNFKSTAVLVVSGLAVMGTAYTPAPKPRPAKELVESAYMAPTRFQRWTKSEVRRMQLQDNIRKIREQIKVKARDRYSTTGYNYGTIAIHSHNLMNSIANTLA